MRSSEAITRQTIYCEDKRPVNAIESPSTSSKNLLVERLGEGGGGGDVGITSSLVGTSGLLQGLSVSKVGGAVLLVGSGVVGLEINVEKEGEHLASVLEAYAR